MFRPGVSMAAVMAGRIQMLIFVFCRLSMDFDNGYDNYEDYGNQEEIWDYGFDDTPDSLPEDQELPPEPRTVFKMQWQAVMSPQHLPRGKVQASVRHWRRCL